MRSITGRATHQGAGLDMLEERGRTAGSKTKVKPMGLGNRHRESFHKRYEGRLAYPHDFVFCRRWAASRALIR